MGTKMFHFPTSPPPRLYIHPVVTTHNTQRGFPIRTPSDHSSFTNSPRLIADYRVLHRPLMPRHPPCALEHSPPHTGHTQPTSRTCCRVARRITQETQNQTKSQQPHTNMRVIARCSRPLFTNQQQPPHTQTTTPTNRDHNPRRWKKNHHTPLRACGPVPPQPNSVPAHTHTPPQGHSIHEHPEVIRQCRSFAVFHP